MTTPTDKIGHGYLNTYQAIAATLEDTIGRPPRVLEVGVADGAGIRMFAEVFPGAELAGVDHQWRMAAEEAFIAVGSSPGWYVICEQESPDLASLVIGQTGVGGWDVIVDDASHELSRTAMTLRSLWPQLNPGGCYVIEDWSHADMILGELGRQLIWEFDEREIARPFNLGQIACITYLPGLIVMWKLWGDRD